MAHWLMKSEPNVFGWEDLKQKGTAPWDDVRNYQARNNMKAMKKGEQVFFYHSNIGKEIVGIMEVVKEHYPDPLDERFVLV
ncbi:MAG TPA: EVE domain-containing protein, partial [Alphaproteobacteria bacterium]|nr:EVE domain-containing protein [Alphaproteobacteria bacterium]